MRIVQTEDGGGELIFSKEEVEIMNKHGKLILTPEGLRHFGNVFVKLVSLFQANFDEETRQLTTGDDTKIEGK